jgi:hypothetical protein
MDSIVWDDSYKIGMYTVKDSAAYNVTHEAKAEYTPT